MPLFLYVEDTGKDAWFNLLNEMVFVKYSYWSKHADCFHTFIGITRQAMKALPSQCPEWLPGEAYAHSAFPPWQTSSGFHSRFLRAHARQARCVYPTTSSWLWALSCTTRATPFENYWEFFYLNLQSIIEPRWEQTLPITLPGKFLAAKAHPRAKKRMLFRRQTRVRPGTPWRWCLRYVWVWYYKQDGLRRTHMRWWLSSARSLPLTKRRTYKILIANKEEIPVFREEVKWRLQMTFCGRTRMIESLATLNTATVKITALVLTHVPGVVLSQILFLGVQSKIWTTIPAT